MPIFLVRHAKAGSRSTFEGDDNLRPLTKVGVSQSKLVAARLFNHSPSVLLSSPYLRCIQTLEPLSELTGLEIVIDDRLAEESPLDKTLAVLDEVVENTVLCSHGDVIPDLVNGLIRRGMDMEGSMRSPRKGSVVVLHHVNKLFTHAEYWDRPVI